LASRAVKLQIPQITERQTRYELDEYFADHHPGIFGGLLDGLVAALRDAESIRVSEPARLIEFERFAEAGCRAIGFGKGQFIEAYAANRRNLMLTSLEGDAVGRAVRDFMNSKRGLKDGFAGQASVLLEVLGSYKPSGNWRAMQEWPPDGPRLSTALDRVTKPLAAVGIECWLRVDRRSEGGTQKDVVLRWRA
jgi:hypothetical protein